MRSQEGETIMVYDHRHQPLKHQKKPKSREVSSRFLSSPSCTPPLDNGLVQSPKNTTNLSPLRQKPGRPSSDLRKQKGLESSGFMRGLWPSSSSNASQSPNLKPGSLAECIGNERLIDLAQRKSPEKSTFLSRQRSCTEFSRFDQNENNIAKEKHGNKPLFGASMRYTGKFKFPGRSSTSSSKSSNLSDDNLVPGRLSVDETALRRKSLGRKSDYLADIVIDSESDQSDINSGPSFGSPVIGKSFPASYMAPTVSSRLSGIELSSKYLQDSSTRSRRWSSDSSTVQKPVSSENSPKRFMSKSEMKRSISMKLYGIETSKLGGSPGRSNSPTVSEENKGWKMMSNMKPPTSPSRVKGVGNLLSIGLELLKGKKYSSGVSSPLGLGIGESVHQLRMFHNRLVQWRYANSRAEAVNSNITKQTESNLIFAWDSLTKLQRSVRQKKLQLQKEKLQMTLNYILQSQIKSLEGWSAIERQHQSAVTVTKDCLQSVVCKVPLVGGANMDPQSVSMALRAASDITGSIEFLHSNFSPKANKTAKISRELAEIVTQEKLLLEDCLEIFKIVSALEVQERSLKCNVMQLKL